MMVGVIGGHQCSRKMEKLAFDVGEAIAAAGHFLVCGGLAGVMHHACRGAKSAGGTTIGILPTADKNDANPYVDVAIPTGMGLARNVIVVLASDVLVAIDGRFGTLSEIAYALQFGKQVFGMSTWDICEGVVAIKEASELASRLKDLEKRV